MTDRQMTVIQRNYKLSWSNNPTLQAHKQPYNSGFTLLQTISVTVHYSHYSWALRPTIVTA